MSKTETTINDLKINRGTYENIQTNIGDIGENELIIVTDKQVPIPQAADSGKLVQVNASGNYELGNLPYITTAPSANNTNGLIIVVLDAEPATKYDGYLYIITGA